MISYAEAIAQCAEHIAEHDVHGYSQPNRKGWGRENLSFSDGTKYSIHWGDYDCSEMARTCAEAAGLVSSDVWMWTGNEHEILTNAGFTVVSIYDLERGDILFKQGHTGIYLGNGLMADAHGDEYGGINGPNEGDQTGREIEIRSVWSCSWLRAYRPPIGNFGLSGAHFTVIKNDHFNGVDVSSWVGSIDIKQIKNCDFAIVKITEGIDYINEYHKAQLDQANESGMMLGVFHYALTNNPEHEAEFFVKTARDTGYFDKLTLWLDYEGDALSQGGEWAELFMKKVDELSGKTCGFYTYHSELSNHDYSASAHRPLWIAYVESGTTGFKENPTGPRSVSPWTTFNILQYSWDGKVGVDRLLDINKGYLTRDEWSMWANTTIDQNDVIVENDTTEGDYISMKETTVTFNSYRNIRDSPSLDGKIIAEYSPNEQCIIDGIAIGDGFIWGHYIGDDSGKDRYVTIGEASFIR